MIELTNSVLGRPITVTAASLGDDWQITIAGGCAPHVGSVSLAEYTDGEVFLRTLERPAHKDQLVGDLFAKTIAAQCKCAVCVTCGIHYDQPSKADLECITACAQDLLSQLCAQLPNN